VGRLRSRGLARSPGGEGPDKLETLLQHNQGRNPPDFDYAFNLSYGKRYTAATPLFAALRQLIDADTRSNLQLNLNIRDEQPDDIDAISRLTEAAFANAEHSSHTEQFIVTALRKAGQLTVSLVAEEGGALVGHVAISPVTITSGASGRFGLGADFRCAVAPGPGYWYGVDAGRVGRAAAPGWSGLWCWVIRPTTGVSASRPSRRWCCPVCRRVLQALALAGPMPSGR
jgi:hypothetical protein